MSDAKHTPGPWRVSGCMSGNMALIEHGAAGEHSPIIAEVSSDGGSLPRDANAALIAAAPELLAELRSSVKMMVNALDNMAYLFPAKTPEAQVWRDMLKTKVREARAAIAKATGGKE
jgi:hypothetical protein